MSNFDRNSEESRITLLIVVGSITTAVIGFVFLRVFESAFSNLLVVGAAFLGTGAVLYISKFLKNKRGLNYTDSLLIEAAQGLVILPDASRSGWTISTGLLRNVKLELAARYSFFLAIPAILGAALVETRDITFLQADLIPIIIGVTVTIVVGYATLRTLLKVIAKGKFHLFSYYCWAIGIIIILTNTLII